MHDRFGNPLKAGDVVLVPMRIKEVMPTEDYCNCQLESVFGRKPDGNKEIVYSVNTAVTVRADFGGAA
jgi:hypothetical protein